MARNQSKGVVITGIGLLTPAGIGHRETIEGLESAGFKPSMPKGVEGEALPEPWIGRLPARFQARRYVRRRKDLKLMTRSARLAVAASRLALEDAGLATDPDRFEGGLFLGVGLEPGNIDDILPALAQSCDASGALQLDRLIDEGMRWMNPLSALRTLPNMAVAHASIALGAMGPTQALCAGPEAGARAVLEGAMAVESGRAPMAIAGAADAPVQFSDRLAASRQHRRGPQSEASAVFVLEPAEAALARGAHIYASVHLYAGAPLGPRELFGDCRAAGAVVDLACAVAQGSAARRAPVALEPWSTHGGSGPSEPGVISRGDESGTRGPAQALSAQSTSRPAPALGAKPSGAPAVHLDRDVRAVAITGVGLRTPLGSGFDEFTDALLGGRSGARLIEAFDASRFPVRVAAEVPAFNPAELPDRLASAMMGLDDRKSELALASAIAATRDHGTIHPDTALVYGTGLSSVSTTELAQDCLPYIRMTGDASPVFDYRRFAEDPPRSTCQAPWRHQVTRPVDLLVDHLGLRGPTACHFSACSAGAAAVGHAVDLVRRGEAPMALAGGADSMIHPFGLIPFILLGAITLDPNPQTAGRPFDRHRDGFLIGEGGAFFVLEPADTAMRAGRRIYGFVLGHGTSCDAHNVTAPHPQGAGAERAMRAALRDSGVSPARVGYINAHGTGTPLNDTVEAGAIERMFDAEARLGHSPAVSSSKGQVGHAIAAAGAVELAACLAAFAGGRLPPNPHLQAPDPRITVDLVEPKGRRASPEVVLSNSFGFGGQNACLALGHPMLDLRGVGHSG